MENKRLLAYQPELKQASRVPSNETRPPLNRSRTYTEKKCGNNGNNTIQGGGNNNSNYKGRYKQNDNRYRRYNSSSSGQTVEHVDGEEVMMVNNKQNDEEQQQQQQQLKSNNKSSNRNNNKKADLNDDYISTSRKQNNNLNHLLNFKFVRNEPSYFYESDFRNFKSSNVSNKSCKSVTFTKEAFLQANCQFMVNEDSDYKTHFENPDTLVDWSKIEEILLRSHQEISCPICLYPPVSAKITKCGHIYCWSCILNYLALSENKWRKCPICFESIYKTDLKSVKNLKINEYKIGDPIDLNLMFKEKSSTLIYPLNLFKFYESNKPAELNDFNKLSDYDICKKYLKLQTVNNEYIKNEIIKREKNELEFQLKTEDCEPNVKLFIDEALHLLDEKENDLKQKPVQTKRKMEKKASIENEVPVVVNQQSVASIKYKDAFEDNIEDETVNSSQINSKISNEIVLETTTTTPKSPVASPAGDHKTFSYFYQCEDGQRIYLNALNLRCLLHEYNTIENCPLKINAVIVAIENMFMNEELRKRFKYLSHIPLHSEFQMVELDLKEPILSEETLIKFHDQIKSKELARKEKEAKEKRRERKYLLKMENMELQQQQDIDYESYETVHDYNEDFPNMRQNNVSEVASASPSSPATANISIPQQIQSTVLSSSASSSNDHTAPSSVNDSTMQQNQMSFAQMLKIEKKLVEEWPTLKSNQNDANANGQSKSFAMKFSQCVSNRSKTSASNSVAKASNNENSNDESESLPAPEYQQSFMFSIDSALQNLELNKSKKTGNKSKKRTKNLLFST